MTFPGLGGQQPPPPNAPPAGQLTPGVTPGVTGQVVASRVIVVGGAGGTGLFVYNGTPAPGNLPVFAVTPPGVFADPFGNSTSPVVEIGQQSGGHWHWDISGNLDINNTSSALISTWRPTDQALLTYAPGGGAGALLSSVAAAAGTDQYGNHYVLGLAEYSNSAGLATALTAGVVTFYTGTLAGGWTAQSSIEAVSGSSMQINAASGSITLNTLSIGGALSIPQSATPGFPISGSATLATVITDVNNLQSQLVGAGIIS